MMGLSGRDRQINTFIIALGELPGIGARTVQKILKEHQREIETSEILDGAFARSLNESSVNKALDKDDVIWEDYEDYADSIVERANANDISILNPLMDAYPMRLLFNKKYPPILYCIGDTTVLNEDKTVAIVGTRMPTEFGVRMGHRLAELLAFEGYAIVSGLAMGSDTIAHEGALDAHGKTIAVLPTPIGDPVYPKQNQALADRIVDNGGILVSEYPPGIPLYEKQLVSNLVARDEWQPGLSDGLVAIETSTTGGTNHALRKAEETDTPIAVFDYRSRAGVDFLNDERFGGNVEYIDKGATPIYEASTIEDFKKRMDDYRQIRAGGSGTENGEPQLMLGLA